MSTNRITTINSGKEEGQETSLLLPAKNNSQTSHYSKFTVARMTGNIYIALASNAPLIIYAIPVANMQNLDRILKGLLVCSPLVTAAAAQIPLAEAVKKNGGAKQVLLVQSASFISMAGLTALSAMTDITEISSFNLPYGAMLFLGATLGVGSGSFSLIINTMELGKPQHAPIIQALFGSIVDSTDWFVPLSMFQMKSLGFTTPFAIYSGLVLLSLPAIRLIKKPVRSGEEKNNVAMQKNLFKESGTTLLDPRGMTLNLAFAAALGGFMWISTTLPDILKDGFNIEDNFSVYFPVLGTGAAILARTGTGPLISKLDKNTSGVHIYTLGAALSIAGMAPLAFLELPQWGVLTSVIAMDVGFGIGVVPPFSLASKWAQPKNPKYNRYNAAIMIGLLCTTGTISGLFLSLASESMGDLGKRGYQNYFLAFMILTSLTAMLLEFMNCHLNREAKKPEPNNVRQSNLAVTFFPSACKKAKQLLCIENKSTNDKHLATVRGLNGP